MAAEMGLRFQLRDWAGKAIVTLVHRVKLSCSAIPSCLIPSYLELGSWCPVTHLPKEGQRISAEE